MQVAPLQATGVLPGAAPQYVAAEQLDGAIEQLQDGKATQSMVAELDELKKAKAEMERRVKGLEETHSDTLMGCGIKGTHSGKPYSDGFWPGAPQELIHQVQADIQESIRISVQGLWWYKCVGASRG